MIFFNATKTNLKILASMVWYTGVIALSIKSFLLFQSATKINENLTYIGFALLAALIIGFLKTKYLFIALCMKNLNRINALTNPKIWQFYRPHFFMFLLTMILLGSYLSKFAQGNYIMLISMAIIELSIAIALLGSGHCYWKRNI
ncbi:MAG: hypothetical protein GY829_14850 [Gammaproteobacteria bacterium]|nr:hypothetical protein [Gammaproteobacteria bacterium]